MKRLLLGLVLLSLVGAHAFAHGGGYRPPKTSIPPSLDPESAEAKRNPDDTQPPPFDPRSDATSTPGDEGDPRGGPPPTDDSGGGGGLPGTAPTGGGTATKPGGRKVGGKAPSQDSWEFWWGYNKDEILNLKSSLRSVDRTITSGSTMWYFGSRVDRTRRDTLTATEETIRTVVLPALQKALAAKHFDIQTGAAIGLAKVASAFPSLQPAVAEDLIELMRNPRNEHHVTVQESGALGLGLLQSRNGTIVAALCDTILDERMPTRTRSFAALSLGLLEVSRRDAGYDHAKETLRTVIERSETHRDVAICSLVAVGLMRDAEVLPDLAKIVRTSRVGSRRLDDVERSYAIAALAKVAAAHPELVDVALVELLERSSTGKERHSRSSAVIALGQLGAGPIDSALVGRMTRVLVYSANALEPQGRNFALIALGKIGGKTTDAATRNRIFATLARNMRKGSSTSRPFAALALGLMGRDVSGEGAESARTAIRRAVRYEFDAYKGAGIDRGAYALSLGMLQDKESVEGLVELLRDRGNEDKLRGFCAIALGLIKDHRARDVILAALEEKADRGLRVDTAIAAGLLADSSAVVRLVAILNEKDAGLSVQGSVSLALGAIGDARAIRPLVAICLDEGVPDLNRALAAVALGNLGDRNLQPILSRLSKDVNYRAMVDSIVEVLSIL